MELNTKFYVSSRTFRSDISNVKGSSLKTELNTKFYTSGENEVKKNFFFLLLEIFTFVDMGVAILFSHCQSLSIQIVFKLY